MSISGKTANFKFDMENGRLVIKAKTSIARILVKLRKTDKTQELIEVSLQDLVNMLADLEAAAAKLAAI